MINYQHELEKLVDTPCHELTAEWLIEAMDQQGYNAEYFWYWLIETKFRKPYCGLAFCPQGCSGDDCRPF